MKENVTIPERDDPLRKGFVSGTHLHPVSNVDPLKPDTNDPVTLGMRSGNYLFMFLCMQMKMLKKNRSHPRPRYI